MIEILKNNFFFEPKGQWDTKISMRKTLRERSVNQVLASGAGEKFLSHRRGKKWSMAVMSFFRWHTNISGREVVSGD